MAGPRRLPRAVLVLVAVVAGLALGVGIDVARVGSIDGWLAGRGFVPGRTIDLPPYVAAGRTIDVGGRAVYLDCRGTGSPTVLLEAGFLAGADSWGQVLDGVAAFSRVCAWDRPGIGRSARRGLHSAGDAVADLRAALDAAGEQGPFVIVAHSLGGVFARVMAATDERVVGLVMIDTYEPDLGMEHDPSLPVELRQQIQAALDDTARSFLEGEDLDWPRTLDELDAAGVVRLPATLLFVNPESRYVEPDPDRMATIVRAWHRAMAARYPTGHPEIVEGAGHLIHWDRPDLVLDRIHELVQRVRPA